MIQKLTIIRKDSREIISGWRYISIPLKYYIVKLPIHSDMQRHVRHKAQKPVGSGRYITGQRRCQVCELFMKWEALWCPCCGYRLRTRPRNSLFKKRLLVKGQLKRAETVVVRY